MRLDYFAVNYYVPSAAAGLDIHADAIRKWSASFFRAGAGRSLGIEIDDETVTPHRVYKTVQGQRDALFDKTGHRAYWFGISIIGAQADDLGLIRALLNPPAPWIFTITRVDVRREYRPRSFKHLLSANVVMSRVRRGRNVVTYSSRWREKTTKRDNGGTGFAIGSHKSDVRVSVYQRQPPFVACEVKYGGGKALQKVQTILLSHIAANSQDCVPGSGLNMHPTLSGMLGLHFQETVEDVSGFKPETLTDTTALMSELLPMSE